MNTNELKQVLFNKLQDEQSTFTKQDIHIKKQKDSYIITIKDYEHINFKLCIDKEYDTVYISKQYNNIHDSFIIDIDGTTDNDIKYVLIYLGYHIANTF